MRRLSLVVLLLGACGDDVGLYEPYFS